MFKEIEGYEDYLIYSDGRVWSKKRNKFLKATISNRGYYQVTLCKNTNGRGYLIHRLLAEHFIPNPQNKRTVNHIDGNKLNNHLNNLEWATDSENMKHAFKNGLNKQTNYRAAIKASTERRSKKVIEINSGREFKSQQEAARQLQIPLTTVTNYIKRYNGIYKSYHFKLVA